MLIEYLNVIARGVSQGITLFSRVSFISKKWVHFNTCNPPPPPPQKKKKANKQKQKQIVYLTTRLAAVEHLLQLCQKKINK